MKLTINGEEQNARDGITITEMLEEMKTPAVGIAVELNREIVSRSRHVTTVLKEGDVLEVVRMVGGG